MPKVKEIVSRFEKLVPNEMKMDFDNVGLLAGTGETEVTRVLTALDPSPEVINEAKSLGAQMIISHHPLFFDLKAVNNGSTTGRNIIELIQSGISCLCLHTNLDCVKGGVNDALANALGVTVEGLLEGPHRTGDGAEYGLGRFGYLPEETSMEKFLSHVKTQLQTSGLRYHDAGRPVRKVALCGGSGGEYVNKAHELGCDTLVTADIKYHQFLEARALGLNLIDADHFCTENVVVPVLAGLMKENFPQVETLISKTWGQTVRFF